MKSTASNYYGPVVARLIAWATLALTLTLFQPERALAQWTSNDNNVHTTNSTSNVGIGTTAPGERLQISNGNAWSDAANGMLMLGPNREVSLQRDPRPGLANAAWLESNAYLDGAGNWHLRNAASGGALIGVRPSLVDVWTTSAGSPSWVQQFSVDSSQAYFRGNVGIGTMNPQARLHVGYEGWRTPPTYNVSTHGEGLLFGHYTYTADSYRRYGDIVSLGGQALGDGGGVIRFLTNPVGSDTASERVRIDRSGNVGIGISTPAHRLDVNGAVNATAFYLNGQPFSSSSQWTTSGSNIYFNSGNIGIGTTNPINGRLQVAGSTTARMFFMSDSAHVSVYTSGAYPGTFAGDGLTVNANPETGYASMVILSGHSPVSDRGLLRVHRNDGITHTEALYVRMDGSVGIGTINPAYRLDVSGTLNASAFYLNGQPFSGSQWTTSGSNIHYSSGNVGVGTTNPTTGLLQVAGSSSSITQGVVIALQNTAGGTGRLVSPVSHWTGLTQNVAWNSATGWNLDDTARGGWVLGADGGHGGAGTENFFLSYLTAGTNPRPHNFRLFVNNSGNVGIGTHTPTERLHVEGNANVNGNVTVTGNIAARYQDIAEWVTAREGALPAGTVVIIDPEEPNRVLTSAAAYDTRVAGVVSAQPGLILGEAGAGRVMVATTGRVRVRVDATRAAIRMGDLLVTSDTPGVAMRSVPLDLGGTPIHRPGTLIGKALEPLERGTGEILVLLSLQ